MQHFSEAMENELSKFQYQPVVEEDHYDPENIRNICLLFKLIADCETAVEDKRV